MNFGSDGAGPVSWMGVTEPAATAAPQHARVAIAVALSSRRERGEDGREERRNKGRPFGVLRVRRPRGGARGGKSLGDCLLFAAACVGRRYLHVNPVISSPVSSGMSN